jgi:predicted nucleic acid-binding protein
VNLFLDASVMLAACGRPGGASHAIFDLAAANGWTLMASPYVLSEVAANLPRLPAPASDEWRRLRPGVVLVRDVWTIDRPAVFGPAKDRPILFAAAVWAQVLLTLDRGDFGVMMGCGFYGLEVFTPGDFLERGKTDSLRTRLPRIPRGPRYRFPARKYVCDPHYTPYRSTKPVT